MRTTNTDLSRRRFFHLPIARAVITVAAVALLQDGSAAQAPRAVPDYSGQVMLIKNTVTAVNHGNLTGNYTVLRDLGSERFRQQHTAAALAATFAGLQKQKLDLSPTLVIDPQFSQFLLQDQRLQLVGHFPTRPLAVRFSLMFQPTSRGWLIDEISLAVAPDRQSAPETDSAHPDTSAAPDPRLSAGRRSVYAH